MMEDKVLHIVASVRGFISEKEYKKIVKELERTITQAKDQAFLEGYYYAIQVLKDNIRQ